MHNLCYFAGDAEFTSTTFRLFKLPVKTVTCGPQKVVYKGGIVGHEDTFKLDVENTFEVNIYLTPLPYLLNTRSFKLNLAHI